MTKTTLLKGTLTALAAGLLCALPASAQSQSVGWGPWIGCWQAEGAPEDAALCVRTPAGQEGAVEIVRVEGSELLDRELLWADGQRHETVRDECTGWERGEFSRDGLRLFLSSSHTCEDGTVQEGGGIMTMAEPDEWLDIRYLEVAAAEAPDAEDVIEASERLPAVAVEAWVAEKGDPFDLNADHLVAMADAGVADRVIDVVVAVSNPDVFVLANDGEPERAEREDRGYYDRGLQPVLLRLRARLLRGLRVLRRRLRVRVPAHRRDRGPRRRHAPAPRPGHRRPRVPEPRVVQRGRPGDAPQRPLRWQLGGPLLDPQRVGKQRPEGEAASQGGRRLLSLR